MRTWLLLSIFYVTILTQVFGQNTVMDSLEQALVKATASEKAIIYYDLLPIYNRSNTVKANDAIQHVKELLKNEASPYHKSHLLMATGSHLASSGKIDSAQLQYAAALQFAKESGDTILQVKACNGFGWAAIGNGKIERAIEELLYGLSLVEVLDKENWKPVLMTNLTWAKLEQKQYAECIRAAKEGIASIRLPKREHARLYMISNMAISFGALKLLDSTLYYAEQAIVIAKQKENNQQIANLYFVIGTAYAESGLYDPALKNYLLGQAFRGKATNPFFEAADLYSLSDLYYKMKNYKQGVVTGEQALKIAKANNLTMKYENTYYALARNYEGLRNFEQASSYYKLWAIAKDSVYKHANTRAISEMQEKFETAKKERALAESKTALAESYLKSSQQTNQLVLLTVSLVFIIILVVIMYRSAKLKQQKLLHEASLQTQLAEVEKQNALQVQRLHISRELHDNIGSQLTFINSSIDSEKIDEVKKLTLETIRELRKTVWLVNQSSVTIDEFVVKLREYLNQGVNIPVQVNLSDAMSDQKLSSVVATPVFRVIQEAVNNALKHAQATSIVVNLQSSIKSLQVTIEDNGVGFQQENAQSGYGIQNMKDRITAIGGTFVLNSHSGKTTVTAIIPIG